MRDDSHTRVDCRFTRCIIYVGLATLDIRYNTVLYLYMVKIGQNTVSIDLYSEAARRARGNVMIFLGRTSLAISCFGI